MSKRFILMLFAVCMTGGAFAQRQGRALVDSLIASLTSAKEDTNKVNVLTKITSIIWNSDPDAGISYGQRAIALGQQLHYQRGLATAYTQTGVNFRYKAEYDTALEYYKQAVKIGEGAGYKDVLATAYSNVCIVYIDKSDFAQALDYGFKALKINEDLNRMGQVAHNLANIGNIYEQQGEYEKALEYYAKSLKISEQFNDKNSVAIDFCNIGLTYQDEKKYDTALAYLLRAKKMCEELQSNNVLSGVLCYLGEVYRDMQDYARALASFSDGMAIDEKLGDSSALAEKLENMGSTYLAMADSVPVQPGIVNAMRQEQVEKSIEFLTEAIGIQKSKGNLGELVHDYQDLSEAWALAGDYKKALDAHIRYMAYKDSVFSLQSKKTIANLEARRELEVKDKQIQIDKLDIIKRRNEALVFIAGIILLSVVVLVVYRNYAIQKKSNHMLSIAKKRSENLLKRSEELLLNILPLEVATELKEKGVYEARSFDNVTVLFADFVNFTGMSEKLRPNELIEELHTCFKAFDNIIERYHIEKIKTVGDAYLVVSGLPAPNASHAEQVVNAATEIIAYMNDRRRVLGDKTFEVRIGIHSGMVVAGIVGVKKFAYDIWGDTVNVAARMEQNSAPGKINISEATYLLVKDKFTCSYRGEIQAKNKGMLRMYYVEQA